MSQRVEKRFFLSQGRSSHASQDRDAQGHLSRQAVHTGDSDHGRQHTQPARWRLRCGAGSQEAKLKAKVKNENIDGVFFPGPKVPEELAVYYSLASCFVLASTIEQWGLVVNEAMACGLPVLVTKIAGAADELVESGVNGYTFDPFDITELSELMVKMTNMDQEKRLQMGNASQQKITPYSPEYFAENILKLINV